MYRREKRRCQGTKLTLLVQNALCNSTQTILHTQNILK
jgi:hypothetical protein